MVNVQTMVDEKTRGEAARLSVPFFDADVPLLPSHLRYMARQMSQILRLRSNEPSLDFVEEREAVNFDEQPLENETEEPILEEDEEDLVDVEAMADEFSQELNDPDIDALEKYAEDVDNLDEDSLDKILGEKATEGINQKQRIDVSELTIIDQDILNQIEGMSDEYIEDQIAKMNAEADRLEEQLPKMTLRERAKFDQYHDFSVAEMDRQSKVLEQEYLFKK